MKGLLLWCVVLSFFPLMFAQSALRFKVRTDASSDSGNAVARGAIIRLPLLPRPIRTHVIVQFDQTPSAETLALLVARGAVVLQDLPGNSVLVSMNGRVDLNNLGVISTAPMDARTKISPLIVGGNPSAGSGYYLVEFYPDVDPAAGRRLVLNMGLELRENPDLARQHLMVYTPNVAGARATLEFLAAQDPVAYIFPASAALIAGIPVNVCGGALTAFGPIGQYIATNGDGWDGPGLNAATLNYAFGQITAKLPAGTPQAEIVRAMDEWAKVIQLTWQAGPGPGGNRTVNIFFAEGAHGDDFPFDGPGGVVAHTFYPFPPNPETIAGDMHFDDSESWHIGANIDVFSVALHELGHALGLGHSDNPADVMYPYFKIVSTLAAGDKAAILTMYAARTGTVPPPVPTPLALTVDIPPATTTSATISLSGTVAGGSGAVSVTWLSSTGASGTASISGISWLAPNIPLAMGLNSIAVTARDGAGSVSRTVSVTRVVTSPLPGPLVLTINAPPSTTTAATISLSGTVSGGSGAIAVTWLTSTGASDGSSINGTNWVVLSIPLAIGLNSITVTATDAVGSVSRTVSVTRQVIPPVSAPLVLTVNAVPSTTTSATITLTGTVTGGSGGIAVTWVTSAAASDGSTISGVNWTITGIPLSIGLNSIIVTAADPTESVSRVVNITRVITTPPVPAPLVLTINVPPATTTSAAISLSGTVSGGSGGTVVTWITSTGASDGASISGVNWTILTVPLAIGFNSITVTARDATASVSRTVSTTRTVTMPPAGTDTTGPTLTITFPASTTLATTLASLTFHGTASDRSGVASVTWSTDTGGAGLASGTTDWIAAIPLLVGFNQVVIRATDTAGNMSSRSVLVRRQ